jgi:uncharacterized protein with LGFP repeats
VTAVDVEVAAKHARGVSVTPAWTSHDGDVGPLLRPQVEHVEALVLLVLLVDLGVTAEYEHDAVGDGADVTDAREGGLAERLDKLQ